MSVIEIVLAFVSNLTCLFVISAVVSAFASIVLIILMAIKMDEATWKSNPTETIRIKEVYASLAFKKALPAFFISIALACIPSVNDIWKVRIGLIKLQLASPENIQKGAEEITRIGKKLECRYLGCDEEKSK